MINLSQVVLERLATLAFDVRFEDEGAIEELSTIPQHVLEHIVSCELDQMDLACRTRIVRLLARDPRACIRQAALHHFPLSANQPLSEETQQLYESLASDPTPEVRATFLEHVAEMFDWTSVIERTRLIGLWATSENPHLRVAVARALQSPFLALGVPSAIRALWHDPDDRVRTEAQIAGVLRAVSAPEAA